MDLSKKLPLYQSIVQTGQKQADRRSHAMPKSLPASVVAVNGQFVTVNLGLDSAYPLPQLEIPVFGSEYIRVPIQVGCQGIVIPCDYYIGNVSGSGTGKATATRAGNLSNLVFFPIGNAGWTAVDGNALYMYGVSSVVLADKLGGSSTVTVSSDGVTMKHGSASVSVSGSGVSIDGTLTINGQEYTAHEHSNGNQGNPTGGVIA